MQRMLKRGIRNLGRNIQISDTSIVSGSFCLDLFTFRLGISTLSIRQGNPRPPFFVGRKPPQVLHTYSGPISWSFSCPSAVPAKSVGKDLSFASQTSPARKPTSSAQYRTSPSKPRSVENMQCPKKETHT